METLAFVEEAGVTESHGNASVEGTESVPPDEKQRPASKFGGAKVGDLIQWESNGTLQFEAPRRVRLVTAEGDWVAVDGSETGIPMAEVIVEQTTVESVPPVFGIQKEDAEISPDQNEIEWMRNRLGSATNVRLLVKGDMGPKEIGKLIKLLEAQKSVLEDD